MTIPRSPPKLAIVLAVGVVVAGGLYLLSTRGPAILVDLAAMAWACF